MPTKYIFLLMPIAVLLCTRIGIELSVNLLPVRYAWIPSFLVYYLCIGVCKVYCAKKLNLTVRLGSLRPTPKARYLVLGIIVPAILALPVFVTNVKAVPWTFILLIVLFAIVNPYFEEIFWRGLLYHMPVSSRTKILYSSILFSFSHYFLWGAYWLADLNKLIPTVTITFIAGVLWMWFLVKQRNLLYPMLSHSLCDVFNLSVAVFYGLTMTTI